MLQTFDVNGDSKTYIGNAQEELTQDRQSFHGGRVMSVHYVQLRVLWLVCLIP